MLKGRNLCLNGMNGSAKLVEQLEKYFAEVDARRKPGSAEEAEEIINEAMRSVRPGYRPHK